MNFPQQPQDQTNESWPIEAHAFLNAFYAAKCVNTNTEKKKALLDGFQLSNSSLRFDDLRMVEFYVLTKRGII